MNAASDDDGTVERRRRSGLLSGDLQSLDGLDVDALALGLTTDQRPLAGAAGYVDWRLCGELSALIQKGVVTGKMGEKILMPTRNRVGPGRIFLFGWGSQEKINDNLTANLSWMCEVLSKAKIKSVAVALPEPAGDLIKKSEVILKERLGEKLAGVFENDDRL